MNGVAPTVIRVDRLPRRWSRLFLLVGPALGVVLMVFAEELFLDPVCGVGLCFDLQLWHGPRYYSCDWWVLPAPGVFVGVLPIVFLSGVALVRALVRLRPKARPVLSPRFDAVANGTPVRVRGRVRARTAFVSRAGRTDIVLASYLVTRRTYGERAFIVSPARVLEAVDFHLVIDGDQEVRVLVGGMAGLGGPSADRDVLFAAAPFDVRAREPGVVTHAELVIADGDAVEVVGVFDQQPDPAAPGSYRGGRLLPCLRSEGATQLSVQLLEEPFFAPDSPRAPPFTASASSAMSRG